MCSAQPYHAGRTRAPDRRERSHSQRTSNTLVNATALTVTDKEIVKVMFKATDDIVKELAEMCSGDHSTAAADVAFRQEPQPGR
jgi:hypothetical protein